MNNKKTIKNSIEEILSKVEKPARYVGGEWNITKKKFNKIACKMAFCFPDVYEVGMSYLGLHILYGLINEKTKYLLERVFCPWPDMIKIMEENKIELFSLESYQPLKKFPIVGFTLQYELSYTNILKMLKLSNIPLKTKDRIKGKNPIIIGGGPCAVNPEPISDFFDIFLIGDGEDLLPKFLEKSEKYIYKGYIKNREKFLYEVSKLDGVYIPEWYEAKYFNNKFIGTFPVNPLASKKIKKAIVNNFDDVYYPIKPIVPIIKPVHDRMIIEPLRGCTHGCRFCQAGMIYRPVREKKIKNLIKQAKMLKNNTGYDDISLLSLSIADYTKFIKLTKKLINLFKNDNITISFPSLRIDIFDFILNKNKKNIKKIGFTFAPEAGTQRMRDVINKGITEKDLLKTLTKLFKSRFNKIKLYFMIGLPKEKDEDIIGISKLSEKIFNLGKKLNVNNLSIKISVSSFVPKPFTPFQWAHQDTYKELCRKQNLIKKNLNNKKIKYKYHDSKISKIESILSRGDRKLNNLLLNLHEKGCIFDSWDEWFDFNKWEEALNENSIKIKDYSEKKFSYKNNLYWDHIDIGIDKKYLWNEYMLSKKAILTKDCRKKCTGCNICKNLKTKMDLKGNYNV